MSGKFAYEDWSLTEKDPFSLIAERLLWKTCGPEGKEPGRWVPLLECETSHLEAILKTQRHIKGTLVERVVCYLLEKRKNGYKP